LRNRINEAIYYGEMLCVHGEGKIEINGALRIEPGKFKYKQFKEQLYRLAVDEYYDVPSEREIAELLDGKVIFVDGMPLPKNKDERSKLEFLRLIHDLIGTPIVISCSDEVFEYMLDKPQYFEQLITRLRDCSVNSLSD